AVARSTPRTGPSGPSRAGEKHPARLTQETSPDTVTHIATTEGPDEGPSPTPGRNTAWDSSEPTPAPRRLSPASSSATSTPPLTTNSTRPSTTLCSSRTSAANVITSRLSTTSSSSSAGRKSATPPKPSDSRSRRPPSEQEPAANRPGRTQHPTGHQARQPRRRHQGIRPIV